MPFLREITRTPAAIGQIRVTLITPDPRFVEESPEANFLVEIVYADGTIERRGGNLLSHITPAQRNALQNFMNSLRTQAVAELLP